MNPGRVSQEHARRAQSSFGPTLSAGSVRCGLPQCGSGWFWAARAASLRFSAVRAASVRFRAVPGGSGCLSVVQGGSWGLGLLLHGSVQRGLLQCGSGRLGLLLCSSVQRGLLQCGSGCFCAGRESYRWWAGPATGGQGQVAGPGLGEVRQLPLQVL